MKKTTYLLLFCIFVITGCAGQSNSRTLFEGQWKPAQNIGSNTFLTEGYSTEDALTGARAQCSSMGKSFAMISLTPHTGRTLATVTYRCD
jgi:hypothetical protein